MSIDNRLTLNYVLSSHGRIVPSQTQHNKQLCRGIKTHGWLGKIFANLFGSGTIKAYINNKAYYLNKASCYKLVHGADKSAPEYKVFLQKSQKDIFEAIQQVFNKVHHLSLSIQLSKTKSSDPKSPQILRMQFENASLEQEPKDDGLSLKLSQLPPDLSLEDQIAKTKVSIKACDNFLPGKTEATELIHDCLSMRYKDNELYQSLKDQAQNALQTEMLLFSKSFNKNIDARSAELEIQGKNLALNLSQFYPSGDTALTVMKQYMYDPVVDFVYKFWPAQESLNSQEYTQEETSVIII